jgi:predicted Zn finger-like uncharacterized protein
MKIGCPQCHAAFSLDDKRVSATGLTVKCPKCAQPFSVHRPAPGDEDKLVVGRPASQPAAPKAPTAAQASATLVDTRPPTVAPEEGVDQHSATRQELPAFGSGDAMVSEEAAKESE